MRSGWSAANTTGAKGQLSCVMKSQGCVGRISGAKLTDVVLVGVVEGVDDGWVGGPLVLVDRLPQLLQIVVSVVAEHAENVLEKLLLSNVELQKPNLQKHLDFIPYLSWRLLYKF